MPDNYEPYGPELEKELMKHSKSNLIELYRRQILYSNNLRENKSQPSPVGEGRWIMGRDRLPGLFTEVEWRNADGGNIPLGKRTPLEHYQRTGANINWHEWLDKETSPSSSGDQSVGDGVYDLKDLGTPAQIVEENFKGLSDFIKDADTLHWYKLLIETSITEYAKSFAASHSSLSTEGEAKSEASGEQELIIKGLEEGSESWQAEYDNCRELLQNICSLLDAKTSGSLFPGIDMGILSVLKKAKLFLKKYQHQ